MSSAVLSLGSNMGDRKAQLQAAVKALGGVVRAVSSIYRTPPWGGVEQDDFFNIVVLVEDPDTDAAGWLRRCMALEEAAGREEGDPLGSPHPGRRRHHGRGARASGDQR